MNECTNYRCSKCDLRFTEDEITGMDEDGNDLCPACGKIISEDDVDLKN
jgi:DNA-directed RNA polymerase subunit RPC12/RpoP